METEKTSSVLGDSDNDVEFTDQKTRDSKNQANEGNGDNCSVIEGKGECSNGKNESEADSAKVQENRDDNELNRTVYDANQSEKSNKKEFLHDQESNGTLTDSGKNALADEDEKNVGNENDVPLTRDGCCNIKAEVKSVHIYGIVLAFELDSKQQFAILFPDRAYLIGKKYLLSLCKTDQEISLFLPVASIVKIDVHPMKTNDKRKSQAIRCFNAVKSQEKVKHKKIKTLKKMVSQERSTCIWNVSRLQFGEIRALDVMSDSIFKKLKLIYEKVIDESLSKKMESEVPNESWYVTTLMSTSSQTLPHPDEASHKNVNGRIVELTEPNGGVIKVSSGKRVFFHRARAFVEKSRLTLDSDLAESFAIGAEVKVDFIENVYQDQKIFNEVSEPYVSLHVQTKGDKQTIPKLLFDPALGESKHCYFAKIEKLDIPGEDGIEGGIVKLLQYAPREANGAFKQFSVVQKVEKEGKVVERKARFHRSAIIFYGNILHKADLQYFFSDKEEAKGINTFYCFLQDDDSHKEETVVKIGWKNDEEYLGPRPQQFPQTSENSLMLPYYSYTSQKAFAKEGLDASTLWKVLDGQAPLRSNWLDEYKDESRVTNYVFCRISDLITPFSSIVTSGIVYIESGEHCGELAFFDRSSVSLFGFSLEKADLQYVFDQNDPVYARILPSNKKNPYTKFRCEELWVGWPRNKEQSLRNISECDRFKPLLFADKNCISMETFTKILKGETPERRFVAFQREEHHGTVVSLVRQGKKKTKGIKSENTGATSGQIKINGGPLNGQLVAFHRKIVWVLGHCMIKADLTHVFVEGQKVKFEMTKTKNGELRATLVWTSTFRPRNGFSKTVPRSKAVDQWLMNRGLTWDTFQQLVKGKLPLVEPSRIANTQGNMIKGRDKLNYEETSQGLSSQEKQDIQALPVFRHGYDAARICDTALSATGPNDKKIAKIIKNDQDAQMAFHIMKSLEHGLQHYKHKMSERGSWNTDVNTPNQTNSAFMNFRTPILGNTLKSEMNISPVRSFDIKNPLIWSRNVSRSNQMPITPWDSSGFGVRVTKALELMSNESGPNWFQAHKGGEGNLIQGSNFSEGKRRVAWGESSRAPVKRFRR